MPLNTHNGLELIALDGFNHPVRTHCCHFQTRSRLFASLMMEGIDGQFCTKEFLKDRTLRDAYLMGRITTVLVLAVLDADTFHLGVDVLIQRSTKGGIDNLNTLADTQHRNLTVIRQTSQQQLLLVAFRGDAVQFFHRLFTQQQRIDVPTSTEDDTIQAVEQFTQTIRFIERRNDEGNATSLQRRLIIAFSQCASLLIVIARDANHRKCFPRTEIAVEISVDA